MVQMNGCLHRIFAVIFLVTYVFEVSTKVNNRDKKLFSLFSIVTFPNSECTSSNDDSVQGTCHTASECVGTGGSAGGNCAAGFGICCIIRESKCGTTVSKNNTYIRNPGFPSTFTQAGVCSYSITPVSDNICQLRLDMDTFSIANSPAGVCTDSFLPTTASSVAYTPLCGTLSGDHIYIEGTRFRDPYTLTFTLATGGTWNVKVSQIECSNLARAPPDCYQYFTSVGGKIRSFNFANGQQLQSQFYTICIRQQKGYCNIRYSPTLAGTGPSPFNLMMMPTITAGIAGPLNQNGNSVVLQSILQIPGTIASVFGGSIFNAATTAEINNGPVTARGPPFTVEVSNVAGTTGTTGTAATTLAGTTGFSLDYVQVPC